MQKDAVAPLLVNQILLMSTTVLLAFIQHGIMMA